MADISNWIGSTTKFLVKARDDSAVASDYAAVISGATELGIVEDISVSIHALAGRATPLRLTERNKITISANRAIPQ